MKRTTINSPFRRKTESRKHKSYYVYIQGFTSKYGVHRLVYFEQYEDYNSAIEREKRIKEWKRKWKIELIEEGNPEWKDLYEEIS